MVAVPSLGHRQTYEPIASQTLPSSANSLTFSSIPSNYTDLVLISNIRTSNVGTVDFAYLYFNGDTSSNYSRTVLSGTGSSAGSARFSNSIILTSNAASASIGSFGTNITSIMSYSNSNIFKTSLTYFGSALDLGCNVMLWRSTAVINSLTIVRFNADFIQGCNFSLYGIKAAV